MKRFLPALALILAIPTGMAFGDRLPEWAAPLADIDCSHYDTNEVDAVCLLDHLELAVDPSGKLIHKGRRGFRVLTADGASWGTMAIPQNSRSRVRRARAWVRYPNEKVKRLKEADTLDTQYFDSNFYTDARKRIIPIPGVSKGAVVFFEWELEQVDEFMLVCWRFQSTIPTLDSKLFFDLPPGVELAWRGFNLQDDFQPDISGRHHVYSRTNIPALPDEELAPAASDLVEQVAIRFHCPAGGTPACDTWADVARWYHGRTREKWGILKEIKSLSAEICQGAANDEEKVRRLCRWVQAKIRYVAISIGMGGYIPHEPTVVCDSKYGDCKDKAFVLMGLLRSQGIDAWPVLCRSGSRGNIDQDFPWPGVFDHCIVAIGMASSGVRFFDPTSETVGYPCLPASLEQSMGLVVREDGGELVRMSSGLEPALDVRVEAEFSSAGSLTARVREVYSLAALEGVRGLYRSLSDEERYRTWEEWLASRIPGVKLVELKWTNLHDAEKDLIIEYSLKAPGLVKEVGKLIMVSPFFIKDVVKPTFGRARRELPVALEGSAITARQEVVLRYPEGLIIEENIEPCSISYDFGAFTTSSTAGEGEMTLIKEYTVRHTTVPAERYSEVKSFFSAVNNVERTEILFVAGTR